MTNETLLSLPAAARILPGRPHLSTLHRWRLRGVRSVKLETFLIGGRRYTSREALERFIERTTAAANGLSPPTSARTQSRRLRSIACAENELDDAGI